MTTLSSAPAFDMGLLQPEDTMELASSPHMPQDDIDLDLDAMHESAPALEDAMLEDADIGQPATAEAVDDDEMVDEDIAVQIFPDNVSDLNMDHYQEHTEEAEDEDILYEDDDGQLDQQQEDDKFDTELHEPLDLQDIDDVQDTEIHGEEEIETSDHTYSEQPTNSYDSNPTKNLPELSEQAADQEAVVDTPHQPAERENTVTETHTENHAQPATLHHNTEDNAESGLEFLEHAIDTNPLEPSEDVPGPQDAGQTATDQASISAQEGIQHYADSTETQDIALHAVKVIYQDSEICLFPPHSGDGTETFFVSDTSLAHESLEKLLTSCRDVLADTIGDDDELVLDIASLGLHISEGSKHASEITLAQVLDVYLILSHNDNIDEIEPLYCSLSSRVCLATQYAYLLAAAQQGKTITEIIAEHVESPETQIYNEEHRPSEGNAHDSAATIMVPEEEVPTIEVLGHPIEQDEYVAHLEVNQPTEGQANDQSEVPEAFDSFVQQEASEPLEPPTIQPQELNSDEEAVQPNDTEYREDVDEIAEEGDNELTAQEHGPAGEENHDSLSTNGETASSGTVEAEVRGDQEENTKDFAALETEPVATSAIGDRDVDASDLSEDPKKNHQLPNNIDHLQENAGPLSFEDGNEEDLLDLGVEDLGHPPVSGMNSTAEVEGEGFEDVEEHEDLFDEADASTDQTLDNTQEDDEDGDDLDVFVLPVTPSKKHNTRSAKRKVDTDDEDEFDLLDTDTPDKKRRRPS